MEWLNLAQNPVYGIDPKKVAKELLRADKFDPKAFEFDDEEWQKIVENLAQPQQTDPRQAIAEMQAQIEQMKEQAATERLGIEIEHKERMKLAEIESDDRQTQIKAEIDQALALFEGDLKKQLAEMKYQGDKDIQFDKLKTALNTKVMEIVTTKELAGMKATADMLPTPPVEPPQRAPAGESYQQ